MNISLKSPLITPFRSSRVLGRWNRSLLVAAAMLATQHAAMAQGGLTGGEKTYRCVVLGETAACAVPVAQRSSWVEERVELGPLAKYYGYLGLDREEAIERAAERGEQPVRRVVRLSIPELTGSEKYARLLGAGLSAQIEEEVVVCNSEAEAATPAETSKGG